MTKVVCSEHSPFKPPTLKKSPELWQCSGLNLGSAAMDRLPSKLEATELGHHR